MGIIEESSDVLDPSHLGQFVGPSVHLYTHSLPEDIWNGSVLLAVQAQVLGGNGTTMTFTCGGAPAADVPSETLHTQRYGDSDWMVLRFPLKVKLQKQAMVLQYQVRVPGSQHMPAGKIALPASGANWHVVGYSCNDQRQLEKTGTAAWEALSRVHDKDPVHLMLGTGDQLYNDNIWGIDCCAKWTKIEPREKMRDTRFTPDEVEAIRTFYFGAYLRWIKFHPLGANFANIPQQNTWDDHDIFDGYGSYPEHLQTCGAFTQIFDECHRMYAVFQQHSEERRKVQDGFFPTAGFSWVTQLGPQLAVAAVDSRIKRSRAQIVPDDMIAELTRRVRALPESVQHVVLISAVPVAYPEVTHMEKFMTSLESKNSLLVKTGLFSSLMNDFGEPELLDDIVDHWSASPHVEEKARLLTHLRNLAKETRTRITLLSGDVHQCIYCFTSSDADWSNLAADPGYIPQIVSSAIGYMPPGNAITAVLDKYAGNKAHSISKGSGEHHMFETAAHLFKDKDTRPSASTRFANRNNFVEFTMRSDLTGPWAGVPLLTVTYHVRQGTEPVDGGPDTKEYRVTLPPLVAGKQQLVAAIQEEFVAPLLPPSGGGGMMSKLCCGCV